jgi:hypothetical protein
VPTSIEGPRPLAKAIEVLERKYGWIITYEDPRYIHESEVLDHTAPEFRGGKLRALGPKGGRLNLSSIIVDGAGKPDNPAVVLRKLLSLHDASGNAGRFSVKQTGKIFHVVPTHIKDRKGQLVVQTSILDVAISLPEEERRGFETLDLICTAIGKAIKKEVIVGTVPLNLFLNHRSQLGAAKKQAREVLMRAIQDINSTLSWQLLYDPGEESYALNIH